MTRTATCVIVDTSALVAITDVEASAEQLSKAIAGSSAARIPAPVLVEFERVTTKRGSKANPKATKALDALLVAGAEIEPFTAEDARAAMEANSKHGVGNNRGGTLNLLDLMVYAVARRLGEPILCTGRDFAATGIPIHPASRD